MVSTLIFSRYVVLHYCAYTNTPKQRHKFKISYVLETTNTPKHCYKFKIITLAQKRWL